MNKIKQNLSKILVTSIIIICIAFFVIVLKNQADKKAETLKVTNAIQNETTEALKVTEATDKKEWARGNLDSQVTVVEYADFQCPACGVYYTNVEQKLLAEYGDKVKFIFANYPLTTIHVYAYQAAEAAEVAGHMGGIEIFWKYHDKLYATQNSTGTNLTIDNLVSYATELGLDPVEFRKKLDENTYAGNINLDMKSADALKITGTPSVFINGVAVTNTYAAMKATIDVELAK